MEFYSKLCDWFEICLVTIGSILLGILTVMVFGEVVSRYVFGSSHDSVSELSQKFMLSAVFLNSGPVLRRGGHLILEFILTRIKGRTRVAIQAALMAITAIAALVLLWGAVQVTMGYIATGQVSLAQELKWPVWIYYISLPIGMFFLMLYALELFTKEVNSLSQAESLKG